MSDKKYLLTEGEVSHIIDVSQRFGHAIGLNADFWQWLEAREHKERTCRFEEFDQDGYPVPDSVCGDGYCSECWCVIDFEDKYCKHCGAKVVEQ